MTLTGEPREPTYWLARHRSLFECASPEKFNLTLKIVRVHSRPPDSRELALPAIWLLML